MTMQVLMTTKHTCSSSQQALPSFSSTVVYAKGYKTSFKLYLQRFQASCPPPLPQTLLSCQRRHGVEKVDP